MLKQMIYSDFSGGYNDSIAALSISDKETAKSVNADYSAEVKALKTRQGCTKINAASYGADVTDGHAWTVGSTYKKCVVKAGMLCDVDIATGNLANKLSLAGEPAASKIYPFVVFDRFYFGDGTKLYVWGDCDYYSEEGTLDIVAGDIVKNNNAANPFTQGKFYQAKSTRANINLLTEPFDSTIYWMDVTDVRYASSNVVREVKAFNPSQAEIVKISITKGPTVAGTVSLVLNNVTYICAIGATDTVPQVIDKLYAMDVGLVWTKTKVSNTVTFKSTTKGLSENGYFDPASTGLGATYETIQEGKTNDNVLDPIKRCTMFKVHTGSYRIFATGNPEDNALYYSEIGKPTYFKSALNKVYPANGYGKVKAITELSESILVSYENGWYAWNGITPLEDATWKPLNLPYGCVCNDSLVLTPYSFTFLGNDGIYMVSASILSSDVVLIQGKDIIKKITENRVDKVVASINNKESCKGIFYDNVYYLAYNTDGIKNDKILKYAWDTKSFTIQTGWLVNSWIFDTTNLYFASKNFLLKANSGYSDIDVETGLEKAIPFDVLTKEYSLGNPLSQKVVQFMGLLFKQSDADVSGVTVIVHLGYETLVIDGAEAFTTGPIDTSESLVWGREWGKVWGYRESIIKMIELNRVSNTFQIEIIDNNLNDPVTLIGIGFIYEETDLVLPNITKDEVLLQ